MTGGDTDDSDFFAAVFTAETFGRMGRDALAVEGSLVVLLASDMTDDGRTILGVANIEDSRRNGALAAVVWPTDVRVLARLLSWIEFDQRTLMNGSIHDTYQLQLLLLGIERDVESL